jgi:hypothetical protein
MTRMLDIEGLLGPCEGPPHVHECVPRAPTARACSRVVKPLEGAWQLSVDGAYITVAIAFCPFCGRKLSA